MLLPQLPVVKCIAYLPLVWVILISLKSVRIFLFLIFIRYPNSGVALQLKLTLPPTEPIRTLIQHTQLTADTWREERAGMEERLCVDDPLQAIMATYSDTVCTYSGYTMYVACKHANILQ